jgi:hypothetical protein
MSRSVVRATLGRQWATALSNDVAPETNAVSASYSPWATWATGFHTSFLGSTDRAAAVPQNTDGNSGGLPESPAQVDQVARAGPRRLSWTEELRVRKDATRDPQHHPRDPWKARLTTAQGEVHAGIERLPTYAVFDHLELPPAERGPTSARRLARLMRSLGWYGARWRPTSGPRHKVRGFTRQLRKGDVR